jgi:hypothetical protein
MSVVGRNDRCRCGSGKKTKRCCGVRRGPSERELAIAFLSARKRIAVAELLDLDITRSDFDELFDRMLELPAQHLSVQMRLPRLLTPALEALRRAIDDDDDDAIDDRLVPVLSELDTLERRVELAQAVLRLAADDVIDPGVASVAMVDLDIHPSELLRSSLLESLSVAVGATTTPSGLLVCTRGR